MALAPLAIGVDVGGTKLEAIVLDDAGREHWRRRVPTPQGDYAATLAAICELVRAAESELGIREATVGFGTPGTLMHDGRLKNSNSVCLNGQRMQRDLEAALGRAVRIANDANCFALSEATDGAGAGAAVVFAVILGTGVGGGIVVDGKVLTGPNGLAGEWGHNSLPWANAQELAASCYCGQRGCIESWISGPALARDHRDVSGIDLSAAQIATRSAEGDAACDATLERYEERLARSLAFVINILDPDVIVLGGGLSQLHRLYGNVPLLWDAHVVSGGVKDVVRTRLVRSRHGDSSGVRGAAWLWSKPLL